MSHEEFLEKIKRMIDDLKAMTNALGLGNTGDEYKIISELFTFKFLNDKLLYDFENREDKTETFEDFVYLANIYNAKMKKEHLISNLYNRQNEPNFHLILDQTLKEVDEMNKDIYNIKTASGKRKPLFEPLSTYIRDEDKELELAKRSINILADYDFEDIYDKNFDYFSSIFEYLIKDYNKDSGKYAEYFTPKFAADIIGDILFNDTPVDKVSIYDPAAGSGTLLLSLAHHIGEENCTVYSQDISQKSTQFLRINLILNKLNHSLENVIEGNTLLTPRHLNGEELQKFDFIVSNPPFKYDFSKDVEALKADRFNRFQLGIPNIPKKKKTSMAIYQMFIQHILKTLKDNGKGAFVVPTGFATAGSIDKKIRKELIKNNWLTGIIHMPSNIFATTGTSVSIVFVDKNKQNDEVMLMDASNLGKKKSFDEGQRTILSNDEINKIISFFKERKNEDEFSILVNKNDIQRNGYNIQAGQYVEIKEEELDFDINERINKTKNKLIKLLNNEKKLSDKIINNLEE